MKQLTFNHPTEMELLILKDIAYLLLKETGQLAFELNYPNPMENGLVDIYWIEDELLWEINHGITLESITLNQYTKDEFENIFKPTDEFAEYAAQQCTGDTINDNINRPPC